MSIVKSVAEILRLNYEKCNIAWGMYRGYILLIEPKYSIKTREISISLCVSFRGEPLRPGMLPSLKLPEKMRCYLDGYKIIIISKVSGHKDYIIEELVEAASIIVDFVKQNAGENCDERGVIGLATVWCIKGKYSLLGLESAMIFRTALAQNYTIIPKKRKNYVLGLLGAFGGAIIGGLLWLLVTRLGFITTLCSVVMGVMVTAGYKKLGGKYTSISLCICLLVSIITVCFMFHLNSAITFALAFREAGISDASFRFCFENVKNIYILGDSLRDYYIDLLVAISINIGGVATSGYVEYMQEKKLFEFYHV